MTSRDFVYWLQGLFELGNPESLNARQTKLIKQHLAMVFFHEIDPSMGDEEHQGKLNEIHHGAVSSQVIDLLHGQPTGIEGFNIPPHSSTADIKYRC